MLDRTLAVIVLNWNRPSVTIDALASLEGSTLPLGWSLSVLMVDNGSSDGSATTIASRFPNVDVVRLERNVGFAAGNNHGLQRALSGGADAVMLLNNDAAVESGALDALIRGLESNPGAGAAAPVICYDAQPDLVWYAGGVCRIGLGVSRHVGVRSRYKSHFSKVAETGFLTGCCMVAWSETWRSVGLFDERFFFYSEDADWSLRARRGGFKLILVPAARARHKVSTGGLRSPWKTYHRVRAQWQLCRLHARGVSRLTWRPALLAANLLLGVALVARGRPTAAMSVPRALRDEWTDRDGAGPVWDPVHDG